MQQPNPAQITLYLMTEKGYQVLRHIVEKLDKSLVSCVVGARDKNLAKDFYEEIKALCEQAAIPFRNRTEAAIAARSAYALAISWRWLINDEDTLIVLHDSILPRYRGFAPLVNYLLNGEPEIGVTALYANAEFDRGDVLAQAVRPVRYPITIAQAIELSVECYTELIGKLWPDIGQGQPLSATPQDEELATYSLWRDEQDYQIDWQWDSTYIQRFVNALGWPYKGASTLVQDVPHRVLAVEPEPDVIVENRAPGKVLFVRDGQPVVVCGTGLLRITSLQTEAGELALPLKQFRSRFR